MKKKIFGITLVVCLLVLSIASSTMAYFTDVEEQFETFTSGNVNISLTGNIFDGEGTVYPGKIIGTETKITNVGTENAYVGAIITLTNSNDVETLINNIEVFKTLFDGIDAYTLTFTSDENGCKIYVVYDTVLDTSTNKEITLFNNITVPATWNNENMKTFDGVKITVKAYATQQAGFNNANTALKTAFFEEFAAIA